MAKKPSKKEKERADFIKSAEEILLRRKTALTDNISSELADMRESDRAESSLKDMEDVGGQSVDEETAYKLLELESAELEEIDYALERIDEGNYGMCDECEEPINIERLMALPFTSMCIKCKRELERAESDHY